MNLHETISADFITAYKAKETETKNALSLIKSKLADEAIKVKKTLLSDEEVIKTLNAKMKQHQQSIAEYIKGERHDLVAKEQFELEIVKKYLPTQFSLEELTEKLKELLVQVPEGPAVKRIGQTIGLFNKTYPGCAAVDDIKKVLTEIL